MGGKPPDVQVFRYLILGTALGSVMGMVGPTDDAARFGRWILITTASITLVRHMSVTLGWLSWTFNQLGVAKESSCKPSVYDGSVATAALGPPNYVTVSLNKAKQI